MTRNQMHRLENLAKRTGRNGPRPVAFVTIEDGENWLEPSFDEDRQERTRLTEDELTALYETHFVIEVSYVDYTPEEYKNTEMEE